MDRNMEPTISACTIPVFAKERLNKAQNHINATERRLPRQMNHGVRSSTGCSVLPYSLNTFANPMMRAPSLRALPV